MDEPTKVTIRLPKRLVKAAKIRAVETDQDFQDVVRLAIERYLNLSAVQRERRARERRDPKEA